MKHLSAILLLSLATLLPACSARPPLRMEPVAKPANYVEPQFTEALYRVDRDRNLWFYLRAETTDAGQPLTQILLIRMFWEPVGGRTSLNATALNASYRFIVLTPKAVGLYEGAGFMRNSDSFGAASMAARFLDGDLRLTEATADFADDLGRARVRGRFSAVLDDARTLERTLEAEQTFFARSYELSKHPVTAPATSPATATAPGNRP